MFGGVPGPTAFTPGDWRERFMVFSRQLVSRPSCYTGLATIYSQVRESKSPELCLLPLLQRSTQHFPHLKYQVRYSMGPVQLLPVAHLSDSRGNEFCMNHTMVQPRHLTAFTIRETLTIPSAFRSQRMFLGLGPKLRDLGLAV